MLLNLKQILMYLENMLALGRQALLDALAIILLFIHGVLASVVVLKECGIGHGKTLE